MRNLLLSFLFFTAASTVYSQKITDTIASARLRENRQITISLPKSYEKQKTKKYPILLLLDGDYLLDPFQGALTYGDYWDDLPEVIIVGVTQNIKDERVADCTVEKETGLPEGKGEVFYEFLGQELIPYIQQNYRGGDFKIIAGHDITAGFLNFFLYKDDPIFDAYISMSPELSMGMEEQIPDRLSLIKKPLFYYQSTADGDVKGMQDRIRTLDKNIRAIKKPTVNYVFEDFKGTSHYGLVPHSIPSALYQIFAIYPPISKSEFTEKIAKLPSGYVAYLQKKYEEIEHLLQIKMSIRINDFKAIEAAILKNKAYDELETLSVLARKSYPKSMLADYEIALMNEKKGDNKKAAASYMDAFQKEEIGSLTRDMMLQKSKDLKSTLASEKEKQKKERKVKAVDEEVEEEPTVEAPTEPVKEEKKP